MTDETAAPTPALTIAQSQKPYLLRAMHEWLVDHDHTPHILIDLRHPALVVPPELKVGTTLILNIAMGATSHLVIGNEVITFAARFSQKSFPITVPVGSVTAIYSKETQVGMMFEYHPGIDTTMTPPPPAAPATPPPDSKRPKPSFLKIVK